MRETPILITGAHRSGTTWVGKTISSQWQVRYVHEPFNIGIKRDFMPLNYWFEHISSKTRSEHKHTVERYLNSFIYTHGHYSLGLSNRHLLPRWFYDFAKSIKARILQRALLKDPIAIMSAEWIYRTYNCDIVITIRHPAAFVNSLKTLAYKFDFNNFINQPELMSMFPSDYQDTIIEYGRKEMDILYQGILMWNTIYSVVLKYRKEFKNLWYFVRHEDLATNPICEYKKIFDFLELPLSNNVRKNIILSTKNNTKQWQKSLAPKEIVIIKNKTRPIWTHFYDENDWR